MHLRRNNDFFFSDTNFSPQLCSVRFAAGFLSFVLYPQYPSRGAPALFFSLFFFLSSTGL